MPGGPPILWALTDMRSAPERVEVDRHVARGLGRVDVHEHARRAAGRDDLGDRLQRADLVVAPLQVHERRVARADGGEDVVGRRRGRAGRSPTDGDRRANAAEASRTAECSTAGTTTCPPARSAAPHTAAAMASVAPLVNTTSRGRAPSRAATCSRASSTATRAAWPSVWIRAGIGRPAAPASHATMASTASGRSGEVEAWSR